MQVPTTNAGTQLHSDLSFWVRELRARANTRITLFKLRAYVGCARFIKERSRSIYRDPTEFRRKMGLTYETVGLAGRRDE